MSKRGLTLEQAQCLVEPAHAPIRLEQPSTAWAEEVLSLLDWQSADQIDLKVRDRIVPGSDQAWWGGSEGFVFGLDVSVNGQRRSDLSDGQLLLKVFSTGGLSSPVEGDARHKRCSFICGPRMNLHLRLKSHPTGDRLLFAGAPILGFLHHLGLADDGSEFVCYVMRNAGNAQARRIVQWRQLREERILTARERIWLAHDLARCVLTLEELGVAHCDLSPENVLVLMPQGSSERPTLALVDFDLFHADCPTLAIHGPSPAGGAPGHDGYLPPDGMTLHEIVRDRQGQPCYDRFALGLLIFEILTWCDTAWDEPLIPQSAIDAIPDESAGASPSDALAPLGRLAWLLGPSVRDLLARTLSRDVPRWPSPLEWISVLEKPGLYQVCMGPMRSLFAADRRTRICGFPLLEAFSEHVRALGIAERHALAKRAAMRRMTTGWSFRRTWHGGGAENDEQDVRPVPQPLHFRWLDDAVAASGLLERHMAGASFCPVCGESLSVAGEVAR